MWKIQQVFPNPMDMLKTWRIDPDAGKVYSLQQKREIGVYSKINQRVYICYIDKNGKSHQLKRSHIIYYFANKEMPNKSTMMIDHHDQDSTNDQITNLRPKTSSQNRDNTSKRNGCSSRYKGVSWHKKTGKWLSKLRMDNQNYHAGRFDDELQAAKEYDMLYWRVKRSTLGMNFPELLEEYLRKLNEPAPRYE